VRAGLERHIDRRALRAARCRRSMRGSRHAARRHARASPRR
jgi:hypothetical protein